MCGVLLIIVGIVAGVGSLIGYRRIKLTRMDKMRKSIIIDLQEHHSSSNGK